MSANLQIGYTYYITLKCAGKYRILKNKKVEKIDSLDSNDYNSFKSLSESEKFEANHTIKGEVIAKITELDGNKVRYFVKGISEDYDKHYLIELPHNKIRLPSSEEGECLYMLSNSIVKKKKAIKERQEGTFHSHITYWETINDLNEKISRGYENLISIYGYSLVKNKK